MHLLDLALQCLASICAADDRRAPVRRGDNARQFGDDFEIKLVSLDEPVERAVFVKAAQMNRPFDDRASAAELQAETVFRNRNDAKVKAWGIRFIDGKLALASPAPLVESREIHKRKPHRPFDLASEEHRGAMRVNANDGLAKFMRRGVD
jgi:hypothetical protein